jgi:glycosyltransferase involved in cell wall biosynthesis
MKLREVRSYFGKIQSTIDELLQTELEYTGQADLIVHLNCDEHEFFASRIPEKPHLLLYPTVRLARCQPDRHYFLIVASTNYPNYLSVLWFLDRVYPLLDNITVKIIGNVDCAFSGLAPNLYERYRDVFLGRVDDVSKYYDNAAAILLPTIEGHGLSIKTIEAMATGAQLVATPRAFRGIHLDVKSLDNVRFAEDPIDFARHVRELDKLVLKEARSRAKMNDHPLEAELPPTERLGERPLTACGKPEQRDTSATRRMFDKFFSFEQYVEGIAENANMLLHKPVCRRTVSAN